MWFGFVAGGAVMVLGMLVEVRHVVLAAAVVVCVTMLRPAREIVVKVATWGATGPVTTAAPMPHVSWLSVVDRRARRAVLVLLASLMIVVASIQIGWHFIFSVVLVVPGATCVLMLLRLPATVLKAVFASLSVLSTISRPPVVLKGLVLALGLFLSRHHVG